MFASESWEGQVEWEGPLVLKLLGLKGLIVLVNVYSIFIIAHIKLSQHSIINIVNIL